MNNESAYLILTFLWSIKGYLIFGAIFGFIIMKLFDLYENISNIGENSERLSEKLDILIDVLNDVRRHSKSIDRNICQKFNNVEGSYHYYNRYKHIIDDEDDDEGED